MVEIALGIIVGNFPFGTKRSRASICFPVFIALLCWLLLMVKLNVMWFLRLLGIIKCSFLIFYYRCSTISLLIRSLLMGNFVMSTWAHEHGCAQVLIFMDLASFFLILFLFCAFWFNKHGHSATGNWRSQVEVSGESRSVKGWNVNIPLDRKTNERRNPHTHTFSNLQNQNKSLFIRGYDRIIYMNAWTCETPSHTRTAIIITWKEPTIKWDDEQQNI